MQLLQAKRQVDYRELPARSCISRNTGFACPLSGPSTLTVAVELDPEVDFETKILVKQWNSAEFRRELHTIPRHEVIALATAERRFEVTRRMLEVFASESGLRLGSIAKSDLILRDSNLLISLFLLG